jgi:hypothetical protein
MPIIADFTQDKKFTERARELLVRDLYPNLAWNGQFVSLAKSDGSQVLQRQAHIDVVVQTGPECSITVEEKIVRKKYDAFAIETHSHLPERDGWIFTSTADMLIYVFSLPGGLECWIMSMPSLRQWFTRHEKNFPMARTKNGINGSEVYESQCRIVPIEKCAILKTRKRLLW